MEERADNDLLLMLLEAIDKCNILTRVLYRRRLSTFRPWLSSYSSTTSASQISLPICPSPEILAIGPDAASQQNRPALSLQHHP